MRHASGSTAGWPIVGRYGGAADRQFAPTAIHAQGMTAPDVVNLVHYDSKEAYGAFNDDPDFVRIKHLRDESIDLLTVDGRLAQENPTPPSHERIYGIEVVRFASGSPEAYRRYEHEGEAAMVSYGFQVEYVIDVEIASSAERRFDLVKVSSFPNSGRRTAFEADPQHARIEQELYPAAVADVIWIDATLLQEPG